MSEIRQKIMTIMAAVFEVNIENIPNNASPDVIENWDSLKHMSLVLAIEEEFEIRFPDEQVEQLTTIDEIELKVRNLIV